MSEALIFRDILKKYRFQEPVPAEVQKIMLSTKRHVLTSALIAVDDYSVFYGFALRIFFLLRRAGLHVTVLQSQIISVILSFIAAAIISTGIYLFAADALGNHSVFENRQAVPAAVVTVPDNRIKHKTQIEHMPFRIGIEAFSGANVDTVISSRVTENIRNRLISGPRGKFIRNDLKDRHINSDMLLMGSIGKMGSLYLISARIVNVENGNVIFTLSENANSREDIDTACLAITKDIEEFIGKHIPDKKNSKKQRGRYYEE